MERIDIPFDDHKRVDLYAACVRDGEAQVASATYECLQSDRPNPLFCRMDLHVPDARALPPHVFLKEIGQIVFVTEKEAQDHWDYLKASYRA